MHPVTRPLLSILLCPALAAFAQTTAKPENQDLADAAWLNVTTLATPVASVKSAAPIAAGKTTGVTGPIDASARKTDPQYLAARQQQADRFLQAAQSARDFYTQYPENPKAADARKIEVVSLLRGVRSGAEARAADADRLAQTYLADRSNAKRDRYLVASMLKQMAVEKKGLKDQTALFAEYEKNAAALFADFADVPEVYQLFLGLARNAPEAQARQIAADLLQKPAPPEIKAEAQAVLDRLDMPGKTLVLKFLMNDGTEFDLAKQKGTPVVLYFWASWSPGSVAALPQIREAAKRKAVFVGVNLDLEPAAAQRALGGEPLPGLQRWEPRGIKGDVPQQLRLNRLPLVYVFDDRGVLRGTGHPRELANLLPQAGD